MLNRQKVLLGFLLEAGRPVGKIELMKWAFALRHDTASRGGPSFFDFLPYHLGPYSFTLDREMDALAAQGYVRAVDAGWMLADPTAAAGPVGPDVRHVVRRYASVSVDDLLDDIYSRYPAYTVNSRRQKLAARVTAPLAVYTAGYEGVQVDGFLNTLVQTGVRRLIDVRSNPIARRYGFHKSTLSALCRKLDIEYAHLPELGIASEVRREKGSDLPGLFGHYESVIIPSNDRGVETVSTLVREGPSVLVCMEAEPVCCHRSRLAAVVAERTGLPVVHLGHRPCPAASPRLPGF